MAKKTHQLVSLSLLPDELLENILARISRWNYPRLSLVSKKFYSLLSSTKIYETRSRIGTTETFVYVCVRFSDDLNKKYWCCLWQKPRTKHGSKVTFEENPEPRSGNVLVPIPISSRSPHIHFDCTVVAGHDIYLISGPLKPYVRIFDCRTHTWRDAPDLRVARVGTYAAYLDEKIYLMGRTNDNECPNEIEVFDIKTQSWKDFPIHDDNLRNDIQGGVSCRFNAFQGKLYFETTKSKLKDYIYEVKEGTCEEIVVKNRRFCNEITYYCVVEDIMYGCSYKGYCVWYDSEGSKEWEVIKGLEELYKHISCGDFSNVCGMVKYGENLLVMWKPNRRSGYVKEEEKIWYAEISLERRCIDEVWGNVDWVGTMRIFPHRRYFFQNCVSVSV